jgi:hypothetical protein
MTGKNILPNTGKISHEEAIKKAKSEYEKYKEITKNQLLEVEEHFLEQVGKIDKKVNKKVSKNL